VLNLLNDLDASDLATFPSAKFGEERGRESNRITAALPILPNHRSRTLISVPVVHPTRLLLDTPATLCPEEYGINNI